ncbi:MAG: hypothetical protein WBB24_11945 [Maribacter sp.]
MKKSFLKFLLPLGILLLCVCNPVLANLNIGDSSFYTTSHQKIAFSTTNVQYGSINHNATITNALSDVDKVLQITTAESEEEENEPISLKKVENNTYISASFHLLSLLFLFSYLENSPNLHRLFSFFPLANRRFVLFQVFRL